MPSLVAVAYFLPGRAKVLSASRRTERTAEILPAHKYSNRNLNTSTLLHFMYVTFKKFNS